MLFKFFLKVNIMERSNSDIIIVIVSDSVELKNAEVMKSNI